MNYSAQIRQCWDAYGEAGKELREHEHGIGVGTPEWDVMVKTSKWGALRRALHECRKAHAHAYAAAVQEFTRRNDWKIGNDFNEGMLRRNSWNSRKGEQDCERRSGPGGADYFDHTLFFRIGGRPVAIVGQPYPGACAKPERTGASAETALAVGFEIARRHFAGMGLRLHVPPNPYASWHAPGHTLFLCVTRPEVEAVRFLPDQESDPTWAAVA